MPGPLHGYRVVDVSQMISGPVATMILGDQGADVIKVEPPGRGDLTRALGGGARRMSPIFATSNRNKRGLVLDLKNEKGLDVLKKLVATADLFVQNFRPGAAERLGIGEEALRAVRPDLIYVSISGFGETGPYAQKRVYDPVIQALSGLADIQGGSGKRPRMMRLIVPDKVTALAAAQAMTAALLSRERTGKGQHVRLAMLDAVISFLWPEGMARHTFVGPDVGVSRPSEVRDLIFETKDGFITAGAVSDAEWHGLANALGHPEWLEDDRFKNPAARVKHADVRLEMTAEVLATRSSEEWLDVLDRHQVPCAPVIRREDLVDNEQVVANDLIVECEYPLTGRMRQTRPAARFDETPSEIRRPAPGLGEHNEELLAELGFDATTVRELAQSGVLG